MRRMVMPAVLLVVLGLIAGLIVQDGRASLGLAPVSWKESFATLVAFDDFDPGRLGIYLPPNDASRGGRAGGELRGGPEDSCQSSQAILSVLAPDDSGWTSVPQPTLFWYFSGSVCHYPVQFTLSNPETMEEIITTTLSASITPGLHRLELGNLDIRLIPNISYIWNISLVRQEKKRLRNLVSGGTLKYVPASESFTRNAARSPGPQAIYDHARAGYWYEAFRILTNLVEAAPHNRLYRKQRICLIEQVGLSNVALHLLKDEGFDKDGTFDLLQCHQPPPQPTKS